MSNVSSRTLRHYDHLGLLVPAWTAANGYRYYGPAEVRRLQRILLLRELGLGLDTIGEVLDGQTDERAALAVHRDWLLAERDRMARMARTVDRTIEAIDQGEEMEAQDMFTGFDENPYEEEAIGRWGKDAVEAGKARYAGLSTAGKEAMAKEAADINADLARCLEAGLPADAPAVQAAVERHYRWVAFHWTPNAESYVGLGIMYVEDARFTNFYDTVKPGLAAYLLAGIKVYAAARLQRQ
jgi:MerR family transcriptional regulator, thiopeptide resistance regulator